MNDDAAGARHDRLARWFGPDGLIIGIAIDHRDALLNAWQRRNHAPPERSAIEALKARAVRELAPDATLVLLDSEYGNAALRAGAVPPGIALVMPLEAQGYEAAGEQRVTALLSDFGPLDAARSGAAGCKLLLPYHPDDVASASLQDDVALSAIAACHDSGMPIVLEPIVYRLEAELSASFDARLAERVAATASHLATLGPDVLKLQFPAGTSDDAAACATLSRACGDVPWVLLGAGNDEDTFAVQVQSAVGAGAVGFIVGRTVWGGALVPDEAASADYLAEQAVPMFRRFARLARSALVA